MPIYRNFYLDKKGVYHSGRTSYPSAEAAAQRAAEIMSNENDISIGGKIIKKKDIRKVYQEIDNDRIMGSEQLVGYESIAPQWIASALFGR